jgi:hypothetical protein
MGLAQVDAGKEEKRPCAGGRRGAGRLLAGPSRIPRRKINPFIFLFQFFKTIFQMIFKSILNLIQTTQYKISNAAA